MTGSISVLPLASAPASVYVSMSSFRFSFGLSVGPRFNFSVTLRVSCSLSPNLRFSFTAPLSVSDSVQVSGSPSVSVPVSSPFSFPGQFAGENAHKQMEEASINFASVTYPCGVCNTVGAAKCAVCLLTLHRDCALALFTHLAGSMRNMREEVRACGPRDLPVRLGDTMCAVCSAVVRS